LIVYRPVFHSLYTLVRNKG